MTMNIMVVKTIKTIKTMYLFSQIILLYLVS